MTTARGGAKAAARGIEIAAADMTVTEGVIEIAMPMALEVVMILDATGLIGQVQGYGQRLDLPKITKI